MLAIANSSTISKTRRNTCLQPRCCRDKMIEVVYPSHREHCGKGSRTHRDQLRLRRYKSLSSLKSSKGLKHQVAMDRWDCLRCPCRTWVLVIHQDTASIHYLCPKGESATNDDQKINIAHHRELFASHALSTRFTPRHTPRLVDHRFVSRRDAAPASAGRRSPRGHRSADWQ